MAHFYFHLIEPDSRIEDVEGLPFADDQAATVEAIRQIRGMLSSEIMETGEVDLRRAIDLAGPGGSHRIDFSCAITLAH